MRASFLIASFLHAVFSCPILFGQATAFDSFDEFSDEAISIRFNQRLLPDAREGLGEWGILLDATNGGDPVIRTLPPVLLSTVSAIEVRPFDDSADQALILDFTHPVRRVGFDLGNSILEETTAELLVYEREGNLLGNFEHVVFGITGEFVGLAVEDPPGISKLVISYGDAPNSERVSGLIVEFMELPEFCQYLPQVASGLLPGGSRLRSKIVLTDVSSSGNNIRIETSGNLASILPPTSFSISSNESRELIVDSEDIIAGPLEICSDRPLQTLVIFETLDSAGNILAATGSAASDSTSYHIGYVEFDRSAELDTGVGLIYLGDSPPKSLNQIQLLLRGVGDGEEIIDNLDIGGLDFGQQISFFLSSKLPELGKFQGNLKILASGPVAGILLLTSNGVVQASVPLASTGR